MFQISCPGQQHTWSAAYMVSEIASINGLAHLRFRSQLHTYSRLDGWMDPITAIHVLLAMHWLLTRLLHQTPDTRHLPLARSFCRPPATQEGGFVRSCRCCEWGVCLRRFLPCSLCMNRWSYWTCDICLRTLESSCYV